MAQNLNDIVMIYPSHVVEVVFTASLILELKDRRNLALIGGV